MKQHSRFEILEGSANRLRLPPSKRKMAHVVRCEDIIGVCLYRHH